MVDNTYNNNIEKNNIIEKNIILIHIYYKMWSLINLNNPLTSAIILYLIILAIIVVMKPKLIKNKKHKYIFPIVIIIVSIISYYIFAMLYSFMNES